MTLVPFNLVYLKNMKKYFSILLCILSYVATTAAQDITGLKKIGDVLGVTRTETSILLTCRDNSQVRITVLAPDLIRVRASFAKPLSDRDHSWAIDKTDWQTPRWSFSERPDSIVIKTDEVEIAIRRSPLLIEFRDAKTGSVVNADEQPMAHDAKVSLKQIMFDPDAGVFVAAAKKLGFDEHFYGLGEKAARLDKRRSSFVN